MKKVYENIKKRTIHDVSTEELENGERPGWVNHSIYFIEGEKERIVFDIEKQLPAWKAYIGILRIQFQTKGSFHVINIQELARAPSMLRERYEDLPSKERIRDSEEGG